MSDLSKATPRPWMWEKSVRPWNTDEFLPIEGPNGCLIAELNEYPGCGGDPLANAALIVRCVNAHDKLLAACRKLDEVDCCEGYSLSDADYRIFWEALGMARAALAAAEGTT